MYKHIYMGEWKWESKRKSESEGERIPVVSSYSLSTSITRWSCCERERERGGREKKRKNERKKWQEWEKRNTDGQGIVCDFVLPLAATSRSHSSISHTPCFLRCPAWPLTEVSSYVSTVRKKQKLCVKERKVAWNLRVHLVELQLVPLLLQSIPTKAAACSRFERLELRQTDKLMELVPRTTVLA